MDSVLNFPNITSRFHSFIWFKYTWGTAEMQTK